MSFTIREITPDDAPALADYAARLFAERLPGIPDREPPTVEQEVEFLKPFLTAPNSVGLVAEQDGEIVGFASLLGNTLAEEAHAAELGISVAEAYRGNGVGTALIEALLDWAPSHGIRRIQLHAWATNPGALKLYERLGFEREGVLRGAIERDGEAIDVFVLARLLG